MKHPILAAAIMTLAACSSPDKFLPVGSIKLNWGDGGPFQPGRLPVPVRRDGRVCLSSLAISFPTIMYTMPAEEQDQRNKVSIPRIVWYVDAQTGARVGETAGGFFNGRAAAYFGIPDPPSGAVGRFDDPKWLPQARDDAFRQRIFADLDILLPFFANPSRSWTPEANKAGQEVRDFFPVASEPGLWPYYRAEGKEFFAWIDTHAPAAKAPLPWEAPGAVPPAKTGQ